MRVHAHQHGAGAALHIAFNQGNMRFAVELVFKRDHPEFAMARREHSFPNPNHVAFGLHAIANHLRHREHF